MSKPSNPPAFPRPIGAAPPHEWSKSQEGMTLRDWFAGQAINMVAKDYRHECDCGVMDWDNVAANCYSFADAMLEARRK